MKKGDIATETVAKILIIVFVIGVVVYLIYRYVLQSPLSETECRAMMSAWCANCEFTKKDDTYEGGPAMSPKLQNCVREYSLANVYDKSCVGAVNDCKAFLPG